MLPLFLILASYFAIGNCELVYTTKFFTLPIVPTLFNWTLEIGEEYKYHTSLLKAPDLPDWLQYVYSKRHNTGFLYGVPPQNIGDLEIEVVGMNRRTYETRRRVIHLNVQEKSHAATHHVHLKIDNLNVDDLFDQSRMIRLLNIFKHKLWTESFPDLYVTFLTSALTQGARLPLKPNESEGVVVRIGSRAPFSKDLNELQEDIKPLWKLHSCPRDFKRTKVERLFRDEGFSLDWCSFKLVTDLLVDAPPSDTHITLADNSDSSWLNMSRQHLPQRSYAGEFAITILVPMLLMVLLVVMLSIILCFQHEGISKRQEEESDEQITQYVAVQRATSTLRSLSRPRDQTPEFTFSSTNRDDVTRPTPPPYTGTLRSNKGEF